MDKFVTIRATPEDQLYLLKVKEHYKNVLKIPCTTNALYRMAMRQLAEQIEKDNSKRG